MLSPDIGSRPQIRVGREKGEGRSEGEAGVAGLGTAALAGQRKKAGMEEVK